MSERIEIWIGIPPGSIIAVDIRRNDRDGDRKLRSFIVPNMLPNGPVARQYNCADVALQCDYKPNRSRQAQGFSAPLHVIAETVPKL